MAGTPPQGVLMRGWAYDTQWEQLLPVLQGSDWTYFCWYCNLQVHMCDVIGIGSRPSIMASLIKLWYYGHAPERHRYPLLWSRYLDADHWDVSQTSIVFLFLWTPPVCVTSKLSPSCSL
jgi:hypothetical protein